MRFFAIVLAVTCIALLCSFSQEKATTPQGQGESSTMTGLQVTAEAKMTFASSIAGRARCDSGGNVYFRPTDSETSRKYHPTSALPIWKIKPDGSRNASFSIADAAPGLLAIDFFVAADGRVYQAARAGLENSVYAISYDRDGSLLSKVKLQSEFFIPYEIAVFPSGEMLVSGIHGPYNRTPFTAVYRGDGRLVKEIYEPEDEDARRRAEAGEPGFRPDGMDSSNDFVVRGDAALGSDGNVYLLRATSPALIYVISVKGEVIRKLHIGAPGSKLSAERLRAAPGNLAVGFLEKGTNAGMILVTDYQGNPVKTYAPADKKMYPGLIGCYGTRTFTFLSMEDGDTLHVNTAEPW